MATLVASGAWTVPTAQIYSMTGTVSWTMTSSNVSVATFSMMTGMPVTAQRGKIKFKPLDRPRGWNAKKQLRCVGCSRFAKKGVSIGNLQFVECGRCGSEESYVGKRF